MEPRMNRSARKKRKGGGIINTLINRLPIEAHLPGYQYCGPGTKLDKRLARGDQGINQLDKACKEHDIAYSLNKNYQSRREADLKLIDKAWERVKAKDSSFGEKAAAWVVTNAMKGKVKLGSGSKPSFRKLVKAARLGKKPKYDSPLVAAKHSLSKAKRYIKEHGRPLKIPRTLPLPNTSWSGGFLIPLFAGLSALGSLIGGASTIAKTVNEAKDAKARLQEMYRHNKTTEPIKIGKGLYLKPYQKTKGYGLSLHQKNI